MIHAKACPRNVDKNSPCTCGGMNPVPPGLTVDLSHSRLCAASMGASGPCICGAVLPMPAMTPGAVGAGATPPKATDDHPYGDIERSRALADRAAEAAQGGEMGLAEFLLRLAAEARLLADLQGKWEY